MLYLLDTNTCIAAMRNHPLVVKRMSAVAPADCVVSTIASYELYTGVEKSKDPAKEGAKVALFLSTMTLLSFDPQAAKQAGQIRAYLEAHGQVIGPYDLLLAGQALAAKLTLVTANTKEFARVPGLTIENWQI